MALARSAGADKAPIGPSRGLDGSVGQVFHPNKRESYKLLWIAANRLVVGKWVVDVADR